MTAKINLDECTVAELLALYARTLDELRGRGVIRSTNNPVADYSEYLVTKALDLQIAPKSTTGYDAVDQQGRRYEIKARRPTQQNRSRQLSVIRGLDKKHFDYLAGVLFQADFAIARACLIPYDTVLDQAAYRPHVNGWILHLRDELWQLPTVEDITRSLRQLQS